MATGMEPTEKAPAIAKFLEANFGRSSAINDLKCVPAPVGCGRQMVPSEVECWDHLTIKEYRISGLCKECQDSVFGGDDEEPDGDNWPATFPTDDQ